MLTLVMIALTAAAPRVAQAIKRDRELELIHRGQQYTRAIKRYYKKFGRYPTRLEDLESTNNMRFLRRRYPDPITGKDDWKLIHVGESKQMQKPVSLTGAGGPAAGAAGQPSAFGNPLTPGAGTAATSSSATGATGAQPAAAAAAAAAAGGALAAPTGGAASQVGTPVSSLGTGPVIGGGGIVGVPSTSEKESLKELDGKTHYNEWEFVYDPRLDMQGQAAMGQTAINPNPQGIQGASPFGTPTGQPQGPQSPQPPRPPR